MARQEIGFRIFVENTSTGEVKRWEDMTQGEIEEFRRKSTENLAKNMSLYFSQHPNEYEGLCKNS